MTKIRSLLGFKEKDSVDQNYYKYCPQPKKESVEFPPYFHKLTKEGRKRWVQENLVDTLPEGVKKKNYQILHSDLVVEE